MSWFSVTISMVLLFTRRTVNFSALPAVSFAISAPSPAPAAAPATCDAPEWVAVASRPERTAYQRASAVVRRHRHLLDVLDPAVLDGNYFIARRARHRVGAGTTNKGDGEAGGQSSKNSIAHSIGILM